MKIICYRNRLSTGVANRTFFTVIPGDGDRFHNVRDTGKLTSTCAIGGSGSDWF